MTPENMDKGQTPTEADSQGHCALGDGSAPLTEDAFNRSIRAATYTHGSHLPADAWKSIACDMRDWARKCEKNAREYEQREGLLRLALTRIGTTELSRDLASDLGCARAIANMALSVPNRKDDTDGRSP